MGGMESRIQNPESPVENGREQSQPSTDGNEEQCLSQIQHNLPGLFLQTPISTLILSHFNSALRKTFNFKKKSGVTSTRLKVRGQLSFILIDRDPRAFISAGVNPWDFEFEIWGWGREPAIPTAIPCDVMVWVAGALKCKKGKKRKEPLLSFSLSWCGFSSVFYNFEEEEVDLIRFRWILSWVVKKLREGREGVRFCKITFSFHLVHIPRISYFLFHIIPYGIWIWFWIHGPAV